MSDRQLASLRRFCVWLSDLADRAREEEPATVLRSLLADIAYDAWLKETCDSLDAAEKRMENVLELTGWLTRLAKQEQQDDNSENTTFAELVARLSLIGMLDNEDDGNQTDQVSLMTLHAAKGLEFPHVFIVGMEEGLLPHRSSIDDARDGVGTSPGTREADRAGSERSRPRRELAVEAGVERGTVSERGLIHWTNTAIEEERRLAYVGITRAKKTLAFTYAKQRKRYGEVVQCEPSRFLNELPADDLQWEGKGSSVNPDQKQERGAAHVAHLRNLLG
jgi:ATP-dependent DNA helicase Rep